MSKLWKMCAAPRESGIDRWLENVLLTPGHAFALDATMLAYNVVPEVGGPARMVEAAAYRIAAKKKTLAEDFGNFASHLSMESSLRMQYLLKQVTEWSETASYVCTIDVAKIHRAAQAVGKGPCELFLARREDGQPLALFVQSPVTGHCAVVMAYVGAREPAAIKWEKELAKLFEEEGGQDAS